MEGDGGTRSAGSSNAAARAEYESAMAAIRLAFERDWQQPGAGAQAVEARADAADNLVRSLWLEVAREEPAVRTGLALVALGGYGRRELFFSSDVDLMFLHDGKAPERSSKEAVRRLNQGLWDAGLRLSPVTRTLAECERFDPENVEFTLALLDARALAGDGELSAKLLDKSIVRLLAKDRKKIAARLLQVIRGRHAKYGGTLFHLEPNIKECPGGLRDTHVCAWLARLGSEGVAEEPEAGVAGDAAVEHADGPEFDEAREFLLLVRSFLHLRHRRDDNTLDWQAQDDAAAARLGLGAGGTGKAAPDAAYWMRFYFRHARTVERRVAQAMEEAAPPAKGASAGPAGREPRGGARGIRPARRAHRAACRRIVGGRGPCRQLGSGAGSLRGGCTHGRAADPRE